MQLNIKIIEAKNVPKMDIIGSCDAYVALTFGSKRYKTGVKENTLNPVWNETFQFPIQNQNDILTLIVSDRDMTTDEDFAKLTFHINLIKPGTVIDKWFDCEQLKSAKMKCSLHLLIHIDNYDVRPFCPGNQPSA